jgi:hypothetical protein
MEYPWYFGPTEWYFVPISRNLLFAVIFALVNFAIATCWIWRSMNRRFRNPNLPSISKGQSYLMTVSFEILIFGLIFRSPEDGELFHSTYDLIGLTAINLVWFLLLIAALTPHRQTLLDWTRYRRQGTAHAGPGFWRRSQVKDLVWGDKSPALVAIALNLMIPIGIFTPWILTWGDLGQQGLAGLTLLFNFTFLLICAAIFQSLLLIKSQRRASVAIAVLANLIILPPLAMVVLGAHPSSVSALPWLLSGFAFAALEFASTPTIFLGLLAHLSLLTLITIRLTHQLRRAGESEMKILMAVGR